MEPDVPIVHFLKYIVQRLETLHLLAYEFHRMLFLKTKPNPKQNQKNPQTTPTVP